MRTLIAGSRGSNLALTQTQCVIDELRKSRPGLEIKLEVISTKGDLLQDRPLPEIGGKGLFTLELENALRSGAIDFAVHSLKDLPTGAPEALTLAAIPKRGTPNDAFVSNIAKTLRELPDEARIGTSSLRRKAQLRAINPRWQLVDIRGNVDTRLRKIDDGVVDAVILACAGLERIDKKDAITQVLPPDVMVPACGQGALAVQTRADDKPLIEMFKVLHDPDTAAETIAERALLAALGGGCLVPIGALADAASGAIFLEACVCTLDGTRVLRTEIDGLSNEAEELGQEAANDLIAQGANAIIAGIAQREGDAPSEPRAAS